MIDKSLATNLIAVMLIVAGLLLPVPHARLVLNTGLFALSGAFTNWLAVHMLFERVPGFYGSGVIPARFEEFKYGIKALIMDQFFNPGNIREFFSKLESAGSEEIRGLEKMIQAVDLDHAYETLVEVIMNSSFAGMLSMFGGRQALDPLREPFIEKMREFLATVTEDAQVLEQVRHASTQALLDQVENIVDRRLEELTPQLVKEIIQTMIRKHLGWLVVWGGVLGGLIGLLATLVLG